MTAEIVSRLERSFDIEPLWEDTISNVEYLLERADRIEEVLRVHDEILRG